MILDIQKNNAVDYKYSSFLEYTNCNIAFSMNKAFQFKLRQLNHPFILFLSIQAISKQFHPLISFNLFGSMRYNIFWGISHNNSNTKYFSEIGCSNEAESYNCHWLPIYIQNRFLWLIEYFWNFWDFLIFLSFAWAVPTLK